MSSFLLLLLGGKARNGANIAAEICPNRLRELHYHDHSPRNDKGHRTGTMGYSRTRRIRSSSTTFIPRDRSFVCLLRNRLSQFFGERHGQGIQSPLLSPRPLLTTIINSGTPKSSTSALQHPSSSAVSNPTSVTRKPVSISSKPKASHQ